MLILRQRSRLVTKHLFFFRVHVPCVSDGGSASCTAVPLRSTAPQSGRAGSLYLWIPVIQSPQMSKVCHPFCYSCSSATVAIS